MYTLLLYIHTAINIYPANFFLSIFLCQRSTFNSEKKTYKLRIPFSNYGYLKNMYKIQ